MYTDRKVRQTGKVRHDGKGKQMRNGRNVRASRGADRRRLPSPNGGIAASTKEEGGICDPALQLCDSASSRESGYFSWSSLTVTSFTAHFVIVRPLEVRVNELGAKSMARSGMPYFKASSFGCTSFTAHFVIVRPLDVRVETGIGVRSKSISRTRAPDRPSSAVAGCYQPGICPHRVVRQRRRGWTSACPFPCRRRGARPAFARASARQASLFQANTFSPTLPGVRRWTRWRRALRWRGRSCPNCPASPFAKPQRLPTAGSPCWR